MRDAEKDLAFLSKITAGIEAFQGLISECLTLDMTTIAEHWITRATAAEAEAKRLREALEQIAEYWNRDQNETAMADACWAVIEMARTALEASE